VPGLVQAVREGGVTVANSLGAGVIESRALMSFLPALARQMLGEDLLVPNVATWWCGQRRERDVVLDGLDRLAVVPAFHAGGSVDYDPDPNRDREALARAIRDRGTDWVGQEIVRLSTMPAWIDGALSPRPFVLRLYATAVGDDEWMVMPGGFCRVADRADARVVSLQQGAGACDVWVVSEAPVAETTLLAPPDRVRIRRTTGTLPSRAADNLFWLARYLERTEATLRLVRALLGRLVDSGPAEDGPVIHTLLALLQMNGALPETVDRRRASLLAASVLTDTTMPGALPQLVAAARNARSAIRDRLAPDTFLTVTELADRIAALAGRSLTPVAAFDETNAALRRVAAFSGLASENMNRLMGWRFLELGRRIERGSATARLIARVWRDGAPRGLLDAALELGDSQITYRTRYVAAASLLPVLDLMVLDDNNPRSIAFQAARIVDHLGELPATIVDGRPTALLRDARRISSGLATAAVEDLAPAALDGVVSDLFSLSEAIAGRFFASRPNRDLPEDLE
jgi:uncharacterized alpha-E superfamily protein